MAYPIKIRFLNNLDYLNYLLPITDRKTEIYQFYISSEIFVNKNASVKEVKIQINNINQIKEVI